MTRFGTTTLSIIRVGSDPHGLGRENGPVSTRKLIIAALICGLAILTASAIQLISIANR